MKVADGHYEFSKHAVDQSILRNISLVEFRESVENGIIIEDYPDDKYGPSCLILGFTKAGRPIHAQCTSGAREIVKVVTLYEPDENLWIDFRSRRRAKRRLDYEERNDNE
ncbi:MAG: DUF4258 domain-containing protein [Pyrinomonadaceae bacterium]